MVILLHQRSPVTIIININLFPTAYIHVYIHIDLLIYRYHHYLHYIFQFFLRLFCFSVLALFFTSQSFHRRVFLAPTEERHEGQGFVPELNAWVFSMCSGCFSREKRRRWDLMNELFQKEIPNQKEHKIGWFFSNKATFRIELAGIDFLEGRTHWVQAPRKTQKPRIFAEFILGWLKIARNPVVRFAVEPVEHGIVVSFGGII